MFPKISIIMPVFNVEKYIRRALDSCINQSLKEIEIIIVDDCGTDQSVAIVNEYMKQDSRIKIIHNKENMKLLKTRYEGVKICKSDYFIFLDSDDFLDLSICERCYHSFTKNPEVEMVVFNTNFQYSKNDEFQLVGPIDYEKIYSKDEFCQLLLEKKLYYYWSIWAKAYKKEIYINMYEQELNSMKHNLHLAEDCLAYMLYLKKTNCLKAINDGLYYYCFNENSTTKSHLKLETINQNILDLKIVISYLEKIKQKDSIDFNYCLKKCLDDLKTNLSKEIENLKKLK